MTYSYKKDELPLPGVPGPVGEEGAVEHLVVDVPVLHQTLQEFQKTIEKWEQKIIYDKYEHGSA